MVATRKFVNDLAGSRRVLSHGLLRPNLGKPELEEMERQVKDLKIEAWKMYTGAEIGEKAWRMDDEKVAYPFWEKTKALGVKNLCVHKGLPLGAFNEEACRPLDLEKAAKDWPDLNFVVYHSGFRGYGWLAGGTGIKVVDPKSDDPQEIPWISDILRILKRNPEIKNIYFELGSTFGILSSANPKLCMHMLGQMVQVAGADHILWGTDSIWNGSPQSQIERLRRFKISDDLIEKHGYAQLTPEVKNQIFGLNAARILGVDHAAERKADQDRQAERLEARSPLRPLVKQQHPVWLGLARRWRSADDANWGLSAPGFGRPSTARPMSEAPQAHFSAQLLTAMGNMACRHSGAPAAAITTGQGLPPHESLRAEPGTQRPRLPHDEQASLCRRKVPWRSKPSAAD